jgi:hypothetical protein
MLAQAPIHRPAIAKYRGGPNQKLKCVRFRKRPSRRSWGLVYAFFAFIRFLLSASGSSYCLWRRSTSDPWPNFACGEVPP